MLTAKLDGKIIIASKYLISGKNYRCTECDELLVFKNGAIKAPHFAHPARNSCRYYQYSQNESLEHMEYKRLLYLWLSTDRRLKNVGVESRIVNKRIADLYYEDEEKNKIVIEIQTSRIGMNEYLQRIKDYRSDGITVHWFWDIRLLNCSFVTDVREVKLRRGTIFEDLSKKDYIYFIQLNPEKKKGFNIVYGKYLVREETKQKVNKAGEKYEKEIEQPYLLLQPI